jgi:hypothetical protein
MTRLTGSRCVCLTAAGLSNGARVLRDQETESLQELLDILLEMSLHSIRHIMCLS